ncbi:MAG TPA: hypothetical protein ENN98_02210 [Desulfurivibrio alkaliphilus]|uniref:Uncharacterized protein n=1 Tax=Desulfurivibrio alkaliphilus TaxID=427923 RepID=A0A7C2XN90_9BACT|nr:hypothetical protein [Desulfurivibrio alkaliphilus]
MNGKPGNLFALGAVTLYLALLMAISAPALANNTLSQSATHAKSDQTARKRVSWTVFAYIGVEKTTEQYQPIVD